MKLNLTENALKSLEEYFEASEVSIQASDLINPYLEDFYRHINPENMKKAMAEVGGEEEAFAALLYEAVGIEEDSEDSEILSKYTAFPTLRRLEVEDYQNNAYYQNIHFHEEKKDNWTLGNNHFEPFEGFVVNDVTADKEHFFGEITPIGYFASDFKYPIVMEKDVVWMSVTPHEINTMKEAIENAHGDVITFGLGLGYYAYMCSIKENVKSVTIIEKDGKIISLFKKFILPQFSHPEKINIIQNDAFRYLERQMPELHYDYAFIDIYRNATDALPTYIRFKQKENNIPQTEFAYWIEKTILCYVRRYLIVLMQESLEGYTLDDYKNPENDEGKVLLSFFKALENTEFSSLEEIVSFLSDSSLKEFIKTIK